MHIQALMDRIEIGELTARYNRCFDEQDAEAWAEVFTEDGGLAIVGGQTVRGRDDLRSMCRATGYGTVHMTTDPVIVVDGNRARQSCTLILGRRTADPKSSRFALTGRYDDELVRTAEGWRFANRVITLDGDL